MEKLSGKQVRALRALGHHLHPVVMIGKGALSEAVLASLEEALAAHELIKIKLQEGCDLDRRAAAAALAEACPASVGQILGKTILLYRAGEPPVIELP